VDEAAEERGHEALMMRDRYRIPAAEAEGMATYLDTQDGSPTVLRSRCHLCANRWAAAMGKRDSARDQHRLLGLQLDGASMSGWNNVAGSCKFPKHHTQRQDHELLQGKHQHRRGADMVQVDNVGHVRQWW